MSLSRGSGFVELYIKPFVLSAKDWDILSEGLQWVDENSELFLYARMHGGNPKDGEVYGFSGWNAERGYVSIHNPSNKDAAYTLTLDKKLGVPNPGQTLYLSSPMADSIADLPQQIKAGDSLTINLKAKEIRLIHFDKTPRDWKKLRALQTRTKKNTEQTGGIQAVQLKNSPFVGTWKYSHQGKTYTRKFSRDGVCTLSCDGNEIWRRKVIKADEESLTLDGGYVHKITSTGKLKIEGRYTAVKID
jgi:hypothetical protein